MLDGLLNRGFSSKCKSLIKTTRTRIEVMRKRAEAKQRFLKEDLAKLIANGLDINAYGRTEEFLAGLNLLSCYDFIEQSCDYVVKNLSSMQKQRECPEECREAVASLMFAAARFSDLPELRDVRDAFQERYGSSLECFVNQKFVEKLPSRPPLMEKRIQLLQDIALEFSIKWDSRSLEQAQANKCAHSIVAADQCKLLNGNGNTANSEKDDALPKEIPIICNIGHRMQHRREDNDLRREELDQHLCGRKERSANGHKQLSYKIDSTTRNHDDILFHEREEDTVGKHGQLVKKDFSLSKVEQSSSSSNRKQLDNSGIAYTGLDSTARNHDDILFQEREDRVGKHERWVKKDFSLSKIDQSSRSSNRKRLDKSDLVYTGLDSAARNHDDILVHEREDRVGKHERWVKKDFSLSKVEQSSSSSNRKRLDNSDIAYTDQDDVEKDVHKKESWKALSLENTRMSPSPGGIPGKNEDSLFAGKNGGIPVKDVNILFAHEHGSSKNEANLPRKLQEEEVDGLRSYRGTPRPPPYVKSKISASAIPPPYVKPKDSEQKTVRRFEHAGFSCDGQSLNPLPHNRTHEVNGSYWNQRELDNPVREGQINESTRVRSREKEECYQDDKVPLPKPRSMRRKHHKSSSSHKDVNHVEDAGSVKRSSSSRRRDHSRKGSQVLVEYEHYRKDEEEMMIDKLLLHYSKKPETAYDDVRSLRKNYQSHPSHEGALDIGESSHDRDRDGYDVTAKIVSPPTRSVSLPHEQSAPSETKKIFGRANSFQPDSQARHVHPKLPDYDDLAARFAALKGR